MNNDYAKIVLTKPPPKLSKNYMATPKKPNWNITFASSFGNPAYHRNLGAQITSKKI